MDVDLYADPSCPWSWAAYLWLDQVAPRRQLRLRIQPFSLTLRDGTAQLPAPLRAIREQAHRALRVVAAVDAFDARAAFYAAVTGPLYAAMADGRAPAVDIAGALAAANLDADLAARADDARFDADIADIMRAVAELLPADEPSVQRIPIVVVHTADGPRACQGPLLDPPPRGHEALQLWDVTEQLLSMPSVYGIARPRPARHSLVGAVRA
jgi:hypothetical protein